MNRVQIIAGAALLTVMTAGGAVVATAQSPAAAAAGACQVTVDRSQAAGSFRVDKQTLQSGNCVCYVYTGPASQDASTEARVAGVQASRECAPPPADAVAASGTSSIPLLALGGAGVAGGIIALASSGGHDHNDSPGG